MEKIENPLDNPASPSFCKDIDQIKHFSDEKILKLQQLLKSFGAPLERYEEAKQRYLKLKESKQATPADEAEVDGAWADLEKFWQEQPQLIEKLESEAGYNLKTIRFILDLETLKNAGLDPERLGITRQDMDNALSEKTNGKIDPEEIKSRVSHNEYLPLVSLVSKLFDGDLKDKIIVKIGPGDVGTLPLAYFSAKGAESIGIDIQPQPDKLTKACNVKLIQEGWENLTEALQGKRVDIIYFHWMTPVPESGSNLSAEEFRKKIVEEMNKALKPGGVIIQQNVEADYYLGAPKGYKAAHFSDITPRGRDYSGIEENVAKKYEEGIKNMEEETKFIPQICIRSQV